MAWQIEFSGSAEKDLSKLDKPVIRRILHFLQERIAPAENPRSIGGALTGDKGEYWKYRVGDYRLICDIQDKKIIVLVLRVRHRSVAYR